MRAVLVEEFGQPATVAEVAEPRCDTHGVLLTVQATGLCRSDWHGWLGHDSDVVLPHVPGHEIAGTVLQVGAEVGSVAVGDAVTVPFVCACGRCSECRSGNAQTCLQQQQPGFTYWGSFAERVWIPNADVNLVPIPPTMTFAAAAALGCRVATAYRAIREVGRLRAGETLVVFGCGGVGLAAVMLAATAGARVIAVDRSAAALRLATDYGAEHAVLSTDNGDVGEQIRDLAGGGVQASFDAVGSAAVVTTALEVLAPRGRHLQVGLLPAMTSLALGPLIAKELRILGSHGMAAGSYRAMLAEVAAGVIRPAALVQREIGLAQVPDALAQLSGPNAPAGITVIRPQRNYLP